MKALGKVALVGVTLLIVFAAILGGVGTWLVQRPWPQVNGTITAPGIASGAEIVRDQWGVPHIYADNELDLFFAQGYVHAQDRLWQMEFNRRVGSGTLSAILGEASLDIDRFMRTIGLRRAAEAELARMDAHTLTILEAYATGVNGYIDAHRGQLPIEFAILGVDPAPWTPVDSLTWGKVMSFGLNGNFDMELLRAQIIAELGEEAAQSLLPPYADGAPIIVPSEAANYDWLGDPSFSGLASIKSVLGTSKLDRGSNNWVVHGTRTSSGKPLLADDTHLDLYMPSIWYENGLHGGRFDAVGFSFPGVPMIIIGHNANIAWGVTNLPADVQDLYMERLDHPEKPSRYEYRGEWRDLEVLHETIEVKGRAPEPLSVFITHHGPILSTVMSELDGPDPLSLRWTALDGGSLFTAVHLLNQASNWQEFREALRYWDAPSQNFVYADVLGNIGYQMPGKIPIRQDAHQGLVPVPGWTGEYDWLGFIPYDDLPSTHNPPAGFIVTANNKVVSDDYAYHLAYEWSAPFRAQRVIDMLEDNDSVTADDVQAMHADTYSIPAERMLPNLLKTEPQGELETQALAMVSGWDLFAESAQVAPAIFEAWYWFLVQETFGDELGPDLMAAYMDIPNMHVPLMIGLLDEPSSPWFDDVSTAEIEGREDIARRSLTAATDWLSENYGPEPTGWQWGRLHTKTFIHQPLGQSGIGILEKLFNTSPIPARANSFTVDAAWYDYAQPFAMTGGVSQRYIADLGDLEMSLTMHTTGQSGQLFHRHREDFVPLWQNVDYHPMLFGTDAVNLNAESSLSLAPP